MWGSWGSSTDDQQGFTPWAAAALQANSAWSSSSTPAPSPASSDWQCHLVDGPCEDSTRQDEAVDDAQHPPQPALERPWAQLSLVERAAAASLGWETEVDWDNQTPLECAPAWDEMSWKDAQSAEVLGFTPEMWDSVVVSGSIVDAIAGAKGVADVDADAELAKDIMLEEERLLAAQTDLPRAKNEEWVNVPSKVSKRSSRSSNSGSARGSTATSSSPKTSWSDFQAGTGSDSDSDSDKSDNQAKVTPQKTARKTTPMAGNKKAEAAAAGDSWSISEPSCATRPKARNNSSSQDLHSGSFKLVGPNDVELVRGPQDRNLRMAVALRGVTEVSVDEERLTVEVVGRKHTAVEAAKAALEIQHTTVAVEKKLFADLLRNSLPALEKMASEAWERHGVRVKWIDGAAATRGGKQKKKHSKLAPASAVCKFTLSGLKSEIASVEAKVVKLVAKAKSNLQEQQQAEQERVALHKAQKAKDEIAEGLLRNALGSISANSKPSDLDDALFTMRRALAGGPSAAVEKSIRGQITRLETRKQTAIEIARREAALAERRAKAERKAAFEAAQKAKTERLAAAEAARRAKEATEKSGDDAGRRRETRIPQATAPTSQSPQKESTRPTQKSREQPKKQPEAQPRQRQPPRPQSSQSQPSQPPRPHPRQKKKAQDKQSKQSYVKQEDVMGIVSLVAGLILLCLAFQLPNSSQ